MVKETKKEEVEVTEESPVQEAPVKKSKEEFDVKDPQVLRPTELPLVITPTSGDWKNDEQATYAGILNGYAYKNPKKWEKKKASLLARLSEIGTDPEALARYMVPDGNLSFTDKLRSE